MRLLRRERSMISRRPPEALGTEKTRDWKQRCQGTRRTIPFSRKSRMRESNRESGGPGDGHARGGGSRTHRQERPRRIVRRTNRGAPRHAARWAAKRDGRGQSPTLGLRFGEGTRTCGFRGRRLILPSKGPLLDSGRTRLTASRGRAGGRRSKRPPILAGARGRRPRDSRIPSRRARARRGPVSLSGRTRRSRARGTGGRGRSPGRGSRGARVTLEDRTHQRQR